jgi:hypothetical protein
MIYYNYRDSKEWHLSIPNHMANSSTFNLYDIYEVCSKHFEK